jgi:hypothetical protein
LSRSLQESTVVVAGTEVTGAQFFDSVSKIWMDFLFDITTGKTVIFLAIFAWENCPDMTCRKVIILFSFIPNSG